MGLGNPLPGRIQAHPEAWQGTPTFRVTSTFQQHVSSGRGAGIDFGNGRCGDPVLAMEAGTVTLGGPLGLANVVRIRHNATTVSGYAHLATIGVSVGQAVARGQQIGTVGSTGADACHLHGGYTVNGVEQDFWPLLDQNIEGGTDVLQGTVISRIVNRKALILKDGTNFHPAPIGGSTPLGQVNAGATFFPDFDVNGESVRGSTRWLAGFYPIAGPETLGYFPESVLSELEEVEANDPAAVNAAYNEGLSAAQSAVEALPER